MLLRRATAALPPGERRWERPPTSEAEIDRILRRLVQQGELKPIAGAPALFLVASPFAQQGAVTEDEILMEAHPFAALSHLSALVFHGLTDLVPNEIHATISERADELPLGTDTSDWAGLPLTRGRPIATIRDMPVRWHRLRRGSGSTGTAIFQPRGYPVRVTDPEMTLLDGLLHPEWSGGFDNVLRAWRAAADTLDLDRLFEHVDAVDVGILRQRTGWILEELEISDPRLDEWAARAVRGGSSRLVGAAPFSSQFNERWKISLNAPTEALRS